LRIRHAAGLAALLAWGSPGSADTPTVEPLIRQLSSSDYKAREAAMRALEAAGAAALPDLRKAQPHEDPEVRTRLARLIGMLERSTLLSPKLVSISADQKPVGQVFEDLAQQTGYRISCQQGDRQLVTLQLENVPFWEAVDAVCRQTGMGLQPYTDGSTSLAFYKVGRYSPHVVYSGPFRLSGGSLHLSRTLDLVQPQQFNPMNKPRTETLTFMFHAVGEPKAPLMSLGQARVLVAVDEHGNSLIPPQGRYYESNYHHYYYGQRNPVLQSQIQLLGPGDARTIRHLKAAIPVTFLAEQRAELTINDILNVKKGKFECSSVTFEIEEVKEMPGKQVHVRAAVRRNAPEGQNDYSWTNSLAQRVELFDAEGRKFHAEGFNWDSGNPNSVTGTFQFGDGGDAKIGKAAKFVYYNWITSQHQIEFEFRDLPLP
jgi:hypothetical protein